MTSSNLHRAEELRYSVIQHFQRARSIAFLPVSALEVHGPHLPLGMDMFMARWMAGETARRFAESHPDWQVVVYPPLTLGTDELPLPGSMSATQREVYRAVVAHGNSLARAGFGYAVVTNGHGGPRHAAGLEAACRKVAAAGRIAMFTPAIKVLHGIVSGRRFDRLAELLGRPLTEVERQELVGGEHAGGWETSFMLAENEALVDPMWRDLGRDGPPPFKPLSLLATPLGRVAGRERGAIVQEMVRSLAGSVGWLLNAEHGYGGHQVTYNGNPSVASAEIGRAFRELMVEDCLAIVESVTRGETKAVDVRSIASDAPIVHPLFFRRIAFGVVAGAALYHAVRRPKRARQPAPPPPSSTAPA